MRQFFIVLFFAFSLSSSATDTLVLSISNFRYVKVKLESINFQHYFITNKIDMDSVNYKKVIHLFDSTEKRFFSAPFELMIVKLKNKYNGTYLIFSENCGEYIRSFKEYNKNNKILRYCEYGCSCKQGTWLEYYLNGNLKSERHYKCDKKVGNWIYYTKEGKRKRIVNKSKMGDF